MGSSQRIDQPIEKLESLKSIDKHIEPEPVYSRNAVHDAGEEDEEKPVVGDKRCESALVEELVKELREVKKQNLVTHRLLSAMVLVTLVWQLSEVSIILKVCHGLSHPFKSLGSMLSGFLGGRKAANLLEPEKQPLSSKNRTTGDIAGIVSPVPPLNMSDLPRAE